MKFDGELITALLQTWRELGHIPAFAAAPEGAYVYDQKNGQTLQFVSPEGMRN